MRCLTGARFTMKATILKPGEVTGPADPDLEEYGEWQESQDPLTGQIIEVWVPNPDIPETPTVETNASVIEIECIARGIVDGGIRVAGTTERFGDTYMNVDFIKMWTPPHINLNKRDRITNVRGKDGHLFWLDEENDGTSTEPVAPRATTFNVNGVTPLFNAFNTHTENFVLLERAEVGSPA